MKASGVYWVGCRDTAGIAGLRIPVLRTVRRRVRTLLLCWGVSTAFAQSPKCFWTVRIAFECQTGFECSFLGTERLPPRMSRNIQSVYLVPSIILALLFPAPYFVLVSGAWSHSSPPLPSPPPSKVHIIRALVFLSHRRFSAFFPRRMGSKCAYPHSTALRLLRLLRFPKLIVLLIQTLGRFYGLSAKLSEPFTNEGKDIVLQLSIKNEQKLDCGGAYIKLTGDVDQDSFGGDTPYQVPGNPFLVRWW